MLCKIRLQLSNTIVNFETPLPYTEDSSIVTYVMNGKLVRNHFLWYCSCRPTCIALIHYKHNLFVLWWEILLFGWESGYWHDPKFKCCTRRHRQEGTTSEEGKTKCKLSTKEVYTRAEKVEYAKIVKISNQSIFRWCSTTTHNILILVLKEV